MKNACFGIIGMCALALLSGCKPDQVEVELYTSDIQKAATEGIVEVPLTASFSIMGEDEDGDLPKAKAVAKRYLDQKAEFKISRGDWGDVMVVKCNVPMGTAQALRRYLSGNPRPFALTISGSTVKFAATEHLKRLKEELGEISMMLGVDLPAKSTQVRLVGDMPSGPEVTAIAVFVDKKAELVFRKRIERRASVTLDFKGGDESVYSQLPPQFSVKF